MNKGRNLIVLMCCLLVLSLLTFLAKSRNTNKNAVVDDVRYVKVASNDNVTKYEFYFVEDFVMVGIMSTLEDGSKKINISHRGDYIEETDEYEILDDYEYYYTVSGTKKDNAVVNHYLHEEYQDSTKDPHEYFTDEFFLTMVYGKDPFISFWQAVIVAAIAAVGGIIIGKSEELCVHFRKDKKEYPTWEEIGLYKKLGGAVLIIAAIVLIVFVII